MQLCWLTSFFFNDTATTAIYTLSLHDALPISGQVAQRRAVQLDHRGARYPLGHPDPQRQGGGAGHHGQADARRSEEHTSELQSLTNLVCRLLLEKKKTERTHPGRQKTRESRAK